MIIWSVFYNYMIKLILHNKRNVVILILNYKFGFKLLFGLVECTLLRIPICSEHASMKQSFVHHINFIWSACEKELFIPLSQGKSRIGVWEKELFLMCMVFYFAAVCHTRVLLLSCWAVQYRRTLTFSLTLHYYLGICLTFY